MARKNPDGSLKEPGQQFEEIEAAQRQQGHDSIGSIQGSKNRDKEELKHLGQEALGNLRQRKRAQDQDAK